MTTFHITTRPVSGTKQISSAATASATTMLAPRITCHQRSGSRDGICVSFGKLSPVHPGVCSAPARSRAARMRPRSSRMWRGEARVAGR